MADTGASIRVIPFKSGGLLEVGMSLDRAERSLHVTRYGEWAAPPAAPSAPASAWATRCRSSWEGTTPRQHGGHRHGRLLDYDRSAVACLPGAARGHRDRQRDVRVGLASLVRLFGREGVATRCIVCCSQACLGEMGDFWMLVPSAGKAVLVPLRMI